jgi:hypothetical protein
VQAPTKYSPHRRFGSERRLLAFSNLLGCLQLAGGLENGIGSRTNVSRSSLSRYLLRWPVFQSPLKAHAPKMPISSIAIHHEGIEVKAESAMIAMTMKIM